MELTERKKRILAALVNAYIASAEPVGSKFLAEQSGLGCSSATIRNELAELVNMGFLDQPHTSAGRVPTSKGYRIYVNELMHSRSLTAEEEGHLHSWIFSELNRIDSAIENVSRLASELTHYPALALRSGDSVTARRFDIIYVDANTLIVVVLLSNSTSRSRLIHLPLSVNERSVILLCQKLNAFLTGICAEEITEDLIERVECSSMDLVGLTKVISSFVRDVLYEEALPSASVTGEDMLLEQPEYRESGKAGLLMKYLQRGGQILSEDALRSSGSVQVLIGPENVADELKDSSVVITSYSSGDGERGLIGVVGPTRMDYSIIASKLSLLAKDLSHHLRFGPIPVPGMHNRLIIKGDDSDQKKQKEKAFWF